MGITREMSKILSTSTAITTDAEISAYNYLSQGTASATYLNQTGYKPGMVLVTPTSVVGGTIGATGSVTFTSASAISLNGCFSSSYENYKIIFTTTSNTATGYINMRLRSSGADISDSNYFSSVFQAAYGSTSIGNDNGGDSQTTWNRFGYYDGTADAYAASGDILLPFVSAFTSFNVTKARSGYGSEIATGVHKSASSFDGITIYSSGNFTGKIRVYGYRD